MVYVTGDIHGWLDIGKLTPDRWPAGQALRHGDFLVICGDFGLFWSNPPTLEEKFFLDWLDGCPWTTLFVDGNHENYDLLDALPTCTWHGGRVGKIPGRKNVIHLMRGQVYEMGADGRWFVMGGAPSHDTQWRTEGTSWWAREMPSPDEYDEARANLERVGWQVDYVFSHDVPRSLRRHAMARHFDPSREIDDPLSRFLQEVDDRLDRRRLKMWYAGHYHDDLMLRDRHHAVLYQQVVRLGALPDGSVHRHLPYCKESWTGVEGLGRQYREWVLSRQIVGCTISWQDNEHIRMTTDRLFGEVTFHAAAEDVANAMGVPGLAEKGVPGPVGPIEKDGPGAPGTGLAETSAAGAAAQPSAFEIVELRITQISNGKPAFYTRFKLKDLLRAEELFLEMTEALEEADLRGTTRVLLCCQTGASTTAYVSRLRAKAESLSLHIDFTALPLEAAMARDERYDVVLMAPQVGYRRVDAEAAFPHATVMEVPGEVFATCDVKATMRLLLDALAEDLRGEEVGRDLMAVRPLDTTRDVLVLSVVNHQRATTIGYRVFSDGGIILDGEVRKRHVDSRDIKDVLATLPLDGLHVQNFDAVGITLPGTVNSVSVSLPSDDISDYDLGRELEKLYGVEVFVDNNANAAAMGCYVTQTDYDSVVFHAHHTGVLACAEGLVVDGHLVKGRANTAGDLRPLLSKLCYSDDPTKLVWTYEGMREVVATNLLVPICAAAPDAAFISAALVANMDALRAELAKTLPEQQIPALFHVSDQRELIFLGELALCIHKLEHPRPHRKW